MDPFDDQLEQQLARLEAGEPLEACLAGLPESEAVLLRRAAALRAAPAALPEPAVVARRRREFLRAAAALRPVPAQPRRSLRPWAAPGLALAGMAALFICVFTPLALGAFVWLRGPSDGRPVAQLTPVTTPGAAHTATSPSLATALPNTAVAVAPPDAQAAVLHDLRGLVELQAADGAWAAVPEGQVVRAGQRLRTGALSGVTLAYYDGSRSEIGAGSELSVDELNAASSGARVVALTQWLGESTHTVTPSADAGSRFSVNTPAGAGTAKGTVFHVQVTQALLVRFEVAEGAVDVAHADVTVLVVAGQSTVITAGQPPAQPAFVISGEGVVQAMGEPWQIAGRSFVTHASTLVFGEPQVGDWVRFEGRVIADGTRVLDKLVLLRRANDNRFVLAGPVTALGATEWVIAGRTLRVDGETVFEPGLAIGGWAEATGGMSADGAWWATRIRPLSAPAEGLAFRFVGTLQTQTEALWTVAGISVTVEAGTQLESGLVPGDVALVEGVLVDDGRWLARSIRRVTPNEGAFEIAGTLESFEPLSVDGVRLVTAAWTEIEAGLAVGDRVRAEGRILDDGTWLAESVERLGDTAAPNFDFTGVVNTTEPWVVANIPLTTDGDTEMDEGLVAGEVVRVEGSVLPEGTWLAREIRRVDDDLGCLDLRAVVSQVEGNQISLLDGQVIDLEGVTVEGELATATVILIYGCLDGDGRLIIITIIVIYRLPELPPTPTATPQATVPAPSDKVTICHRPPGNPDNARTLTVGAPAVPAHLGHGDTLGPCP